MSAANGKAQGLARRAEEKIQQHGKRELNQVVLDVAAHHEEQSGQFQSPACPAAPQIDIDARHQEGLGQHLRIVHPHIAACSGAEESHEEQSGEPCGAP